MKNVPCSQIPVGLLGIAAERRGHPGTPCKAVRLHQAEEWMRQVKDTSREGRGGHGLAASTLSKDALMGPYCVFCDNPAYSSQNHRTNPELEGTLEVT